MRSITGVIQAIINQLPDNLEKKQDIIKQLKHIISSRYWKAPEQYVESWGELNFVCNTLIYEKYLNEEWCKTIGEIVGGILDYNDYL